MSSRACVDTGLITLYYQKEPPQKIKNLIQSIKNKKILATIPYTILVEVYKHLCVIGGNDYAASCIRSFQHNVHPTLIPLTPELILKAGRLKCQYRRILSYNDSIIIATALEEKANLHTAEKHLPAIRNLKIIKYEF